jgi:23S rRNA (adenine1618-N6)-methyltransferase
MQNITQNDLVNRITLQKTSSTDPTILPIASISQETDQMISITMCNPPFYSSHDEIATLRAKKDAPPEGVCTGSEVEMVYPGGEVGFIEKMMRDSLIIASYTRYVFLGPNCFPTSCFLLDEI